MSTASCMNCSHLGRNSHYDGPCSAPDCTCTRYIAPISPARYQALLDWAHTGQDMTNIKGNDLPAILLSYEQVVKGLFDLRGILEDIIPDARHGLDSGDIVREQMIAAFEKQLRVIFGLED